MIKSTGESSMNAKRNESWGRWSWPNKRFGPSPLGSFSWPPTMCSALCRVCEGRGRKLLPWPRVHFLLVVSKGTPLMLVPSFQNADAMGSLKVTATIIVVIIQQDKQDPTHSQGWRPLLTFTHNSPHTPTHNPRLSHTLLLPTLPWV